MTLKELSKLNPDAFSRFQIVCNQIKLEFPKKNVKILDIGGSSTYLFDFLNANNISFDLTIVDIVDFPGKPKETHLIIQSAEKLSFPDNSFDCVIGIDMLEHIPNVHTKEKIINEAIRTSNNLIIFAGPIETPLVTQFEKRLNNQNKLLFGINQRWLAEHFKYGKPQKELLMSCFKRSDLKPEVFSALPLNEWYISSLANLMPAITASVPKTRLNKLNSEYNERFIKPNNNLIADFSATQEGYRTFFVAAKKKTNKSIYRFDPYLSESMVIQSYVETIVAGLYKTKDYFTQNKHLTWYKEENRKLKKEKEKLSLETERLKEEIKHAPGAIVRRVKQVKNHIHSKDKR